jgi:hypothetical protein
MAEKPRMQEAEMNICRTGSLSPCPSKDLKRGLRRARRRVSKKIIEAELNEKNVKAHHR